jgi:hypothetical protein
MAGTLTVDTIQSDSSYASTLNVASKMNFTSGMQIGGQDATLGGMRNRVINGDMRINQRNWSGNPSSNQVYTLDRWNYNSDQTTAISIEQSSDAPAGFVNSMLVTSLAATSIGSGNYVNLESKIEGYNIADFNWGTANASPVTLSFWVKSSLSGTFGGSIRNPVSTWGYPYSYTLVANTWTKVIVNIPAATNTTYASWGTTNNAGLYMYFDFGTGATYTAPAGSWVNKNTVGADGTTKLVNTNGATWQITGIQLEKGSAATAFEYRQYSTELQLCQRYFEITGEISNSFLLQGYAASAGAQRHPIYYTTRKRTTPTVTISGGGTTGWSYSNGSGLFVAAAGTDTTRLEFNAAAAGITFVYNNNGGYVTSSAEL